MEAARAVLAGEKGALDAEAKELVEFAKKLQVRSLHRVFKGEGELQV